MDVLQAIPNMALDPPVVRALTTQAWTFGGASEASRQAPLSASGALGGASASWARELFNRSPWRREAERSLADAESNQGFSCLGKQVTPSLPSGLLPCARPSAVLPPFLLLFFHPFSVLFWGSFGALKPLLPLPLLPRLMLLGALWLFGSRVVTILSHHPGDPPFLRSSGHPKR